MSFAAPDPTTRTVVDTRSWSLHWRGRVFRESELTGRHLSVLALIAGRDDFDMLEMNPMLGHQRLMMVLAAFLAVEATEGIEDTEEAADAVAAVLKRVADSPAEEIIGALHYD